MKRHKPPSERRRGSRLHIIERASVIGLDGVGRQVATQLAALGVPWLQLVDPGIVSNRKQAVEGYAWEDIGHPKVHAVAHLCHQLNPKMEIHVVPKRSLRGLDLGEAVFCCTPLARVPQPLSGSSGSRIRFAARCRPVGMAIHLDFVVDGGSMAKQKRHPGIGSPSRRAPVVPIHVATVAAGLLVAEFVRFAAGQRPVRTIRFDPRLPSLEVEQPR